MFTTIPNLSPEQTADAERIYHALRKATENDQWRMAQLLASKPDSKLLGETEFQIRDIVHEIGAKAIQTALNGRKKGGTKGPV